MTQQIDFSKFIGKRYSIIGIIWENILKTIPLWYDMSIDYNTLFREDFEEETPDYKKTTIDQLEYGDIFIEEENIAYLFKDNFHIFRWIDDKNIVDTVRLIDHNNKEKLVNCDLNNDWWEVIKFLRN